MSASTPTAKKENEDECMANVHWVKQWAVTGLGMFSNAYTILAVGNIAPILRESDPACWDPTSPANGCSKFLRDSVHFSVFVGIVTGMVIGGYFGDKLGRRRGLIGSALVMLIGSLLIITSNGATLQAQYTWYVVALGIFGLGVGAEYPLMAVASAEKAEHERLALIAAAAAAESTTPLARHKRGQEVSLSFSMQGCGNWTNTLVILLLLVMVGQTGTDYDAQKLTYVWRLQYCFGTLVLVGLLYYRYTHVKESEIWLAQQAKTTAENKVSEGGEGVTATKQDGLFSWWTPELKLFFKLYWPRMIGTGGGWFVWDMNFYGNRIFQAEFIKLFVPNASIFEVLKWTFVNSTIAYVGYFVAASTLDSPWMGRRRMQLMGFGMLFACFTIGALFWTQLVDGSTHLTLQLLYYTTTFFQQWGPNATTYIFPSEVYPTQKRAIGHGLSGACGKLGALTATILFTMIDSRTRFYLCGACGIVGFALTYFFLPEVMSMPLLENDSFWDSCRALLPCNADKRIVLVTSPPPAVVIGKSDPALVVNEAAGSPNGGRKMSKSFASSGGVATAGITAATTDHRFMDHVSIFERKVNHFNETVRHCV